MKEAELLFSEILNCDRASLYLNKNISLDKEKFNRISSVLKRRIQAEPIQYILGKAEFMGLEFKVNKDVFIPRPETEILVETAVKYALSRQLSALSQNILDIGTGSGCIAVSLAKMLPAANITATDISKKAIDIAKYNAAVNNVSDKIKFIVSDLFSNPELRTPGSELMVSNPPYIPSEEIVNLQPELQYEPRLALDAGEDGLDFYRRIIGDSPQYLKEGGYLILEIGYSQRPSVENIFKKFRNFQIVEVVKDYNNIERVIVSRKSKDG